MSSPKKPKRSGTAQGGKAKPRAKPSASVASLPEIPRIDPSRLPLFTLLSFALVAFTIEADNAFEERMPHGTSDYGARGGGQDRVWLTSMAMYLNCLKHVGDGGIRAGDLEGIARTYTNLAGMTRWRYVTIAPDPADTRKKIPARDWIIRLTPAGKRAREIWQPLIGEIETRWEQRFGADAIRELHDALRDVAAQIDVHLNTHTGADLPECMPILGYGLSNRLTEMPRTSGAPSAIAGLSLPALLARILLAFAIEFESRSQGSLAIGANVLRVLSEDGVPLRDIPMLSGVSKESIAMAMGILMKYKLVEEGKSASLKTGKLVRLTPKGSEFKARALQLVESIESAWRERFGDRAMRRLRGALEALVRAEGAELDANGNASLLYAAIKPHAEGWRARVKTPRTLPHFPMVLHRGGYPDGS
jgi:DNA-binding MarR family transcriptional regulator